MQKLWVLVVLISILTTTINAQLFTVMGVGPPKVGLLYNLPITTPGIYMKTMYGWVDRYQFYSDNIRVGAGLSIPIEKDNFAVYVGGNYNYFFNIKDNSPFIDLSLIHKLSFDVGVSKTINKFTILLMYDFLNREPVVGVTYRFNKYGKY
jgi:hypothetical protein